LLNLVDQQLKDLNHHEKDIVYENVQARIRTSHLMNLANKYEGFVLGTGDLSEIALGFMTYNGDQMSHYAINAGLPKTWIKAMIKWHASKSSAEISKTLNEVLNSTITPELKDNQATEKIIGAYEINDFIMYHHLIGGASKEKLIWLVKKVFNVNLEQAKTYVDRFMNLFYSQQFKRQTLPESPKILNFSLSPRGEYRMPSDIKRK
jgi:NAD+ synthase (glutamine-hydrolysing)